MRPKSTRRTPGGTPTVLIIPDQTHDEIERRQRIRESLHDAKAVTVRPTRRRQPGKKAL